MSDTCTLTLRCKKKDLPAVIDAFDYEPKNDDAVDMDDYDDVVELRFWECNHGGYDPLHELADQRVTFTGHHSDGGAYMGAYFASHGGQYVNVDAPQGEIMVPIDLDLLEIDPDVKAKLIRYRELDEDADKALRGEKPTERRLAIDIADLRLAPCEREAGDEPGAEYFRLMGNVEICGGLFIAEAIQVVETEDDAPAGLQQKPADEGLGEYFEGLLAGIRSYSGIELLEIDAGGGPRRYALFIYPVDQ